MDKYDSSVDLAALAEDDALEDYILGRVTEQSPSKVVVGLRVGKRASTVMFEKAGRKTTRGTSLLVRSGCLTQVFTATLILLAVREGRLALHDELPTILPAAAAHGGDTFLGVTVRDLLNHTHGLDGSLIRRLSRRPDARIDTQHLCTRLGSTQPLSDPGKLYYADYIGSCLAAAILEHIFDMTFEEALGEKLFKALGFVVRKDSTDDGPISPATGGPLLISTEELLKFLTWHLRECSVELASGSSSSGLMAMHRGTVPAPGFNLERGSGLGWKWYGQEWFGHFGGSGSSSVVARIHVGHEIALAITAVGGNALHAAARLFGAALPEFSTLQVPSLLRDRELEAFSFGSYVGWYRNAATSIRVGYSGALRLEIYVYSRIDDQASDCPTWTDTLRPCGNNLFRLDSAPSGYDMFSFFSELRHPGYTYLHNGPQLFRRASGKLGIYTD